MQGDHPKVAFFPPLGAAVSLALVAASSYLWPLTENASFDDQAYFAGAGLFFAGGGIGLWAIWTFWRAGTPVEPHKPTVALAKSGPYRFTRNPMYIGLVWVVAGLSAMFFDVFWGCVWSLVLALALHFGVVRREEVYLEAKFGDDYRALKEQSRRWL